MTIYDVKMDISVTDFKARCLDLIRRVERTGKPLTIKRRGKTVARLEPARSLDPGLKPWEQLRVRSEEHTSELQSQSNLVCRLLLENKKHILFAPTIYRFQTTFQKLLPTSVEHIVPLGTSVTAYDVDALRNRRTRAAR